MAGAYVILVYILSFGVSFSLGANDGANGLASSYGSGAANVWVLLIGGAFFEFIGAYFMSGQVAAKVVVRMIPTIYDIDPMPNIQDRLMFSMSLGSFIFVMCVTFMGMPISCTHTMIGGLLGAGVFGLGFGSLNWSYMGKVVLSWFVSPILTGSLCFVLILITTSTTLNGFNASLKWRIRNIQLLVGFTGVVLAYLFLMIVQKNYTKKGESIIKPWQYWFLLVGFVCGYLITRFFLIFVSKSKASTGRKIGFFFSLVTTDLIEEAIADDHEMRVNIKGVRVYPKDEQDPNAVKDDASVPKGDQEVAPAINAEAENAPAKDGENLEVYDAGNAAEKKDGEVKVNDEAAAAKAQEAPNYPGSKVEGMYVINEVFRYLGVIASFTMCMSHGSNDVANSISPLLVVQQAHANYLGEENTSKLGYWVGGVGIAFGIILLGERVMITVGKKIIRLTYVVDFCAQMATAIIVICKSYIGMPVSTTHCMVGSLLGVYLARKLNFVNYAYCTDDQKEEAKNYLEESAERKGAEYGLDKKLFAKIFGWWVATVPASFILAGVTAWILSLFTK